jgi:UDP-hydrolysing UDP-N-acetyl-D-glucosamine 2-epimerase
MSIKKKIRKICIVVNSRANYARIKSVLTSIKINSSMNLILFLGASANLNRFGNLENIIKNDGFKITAKIFNIVEGNNPITMAKSTGLAIIELTNIFNIYKPDIVLTVADRFETLATAVAASYMNIFLAHTQGGEISGSIDESVRHAVTKLSHIHFAATKKSKLNIIKMGENRNNVFFTGCPALDLAKNIKSINKVFNKKINSSGTGSVIDLHKKYFIVMQHPVTTEYGSGSEQIRQTIKAIKKLKTQTLWFWPNVDAGNDEISLELRKLIESKKLTNIRFLKNLAPEDFLILFKNCSCIIGNSSSALREGSFLGVPAVNIGSRQNNREHGRNVIFTNANYKNIIKAVNYQLNKKKYEKEKIFTIGNAGKKIASILSKCNLNIKKTLKY